MECTKLQDMVIVFSTFIHILIEGPLSLFNGASMTAVRGLLMTMGQVGFYDQGKQMLLSSGYEIVVYDF